MGNYLLTAEEAEIKTKHNIIKKKAKSGDIDAKWEYANNSLKKKNKFDEDDMCHILDKYIDVMNCIKCSKFEKGKKWKIIGDKLKNKFDLEGAVLTNNVSILLSKIVLCYVQSKKYGYEDAKESLTEINRIKSTMQHWQEKQYY